MTLDYEIEKLILEPESKTLEFKADINDPKLLAKLISAFANSNGGIIIIGIGNSGRIVGCNVNKIKIILNEAKKYISPIPTIELVSKKIRNKELALIKVNKSDEVVISSYGAYIRVGSLTKAIKPKQIVPLLRPKNEKDIEHIAETISNLSKVIEDLQKDLNKSNSFKNKFKDYFIGGLIGAILGAIFTLII